MTSYRDGAELLRVHEDGTLAHRGALRIFESPVGVDVFQSGGAAYAVTAGHGGSAVRLLGLNASGSAIDDLASLSNTNELELEGSLGVDVFASGNGSTYALVASIGDHGVQLLRVDLATPALRPVAGLNDTASLRLAGAADAAVFGLGGDTYAAVASHNENGVQLLRVDPAAAGGNGSLLPVDDLGGNGSLALNGALAIDDFEWDGGTYLAVASRGEAGVAAGVQMLRVNLAAGGAGASLEAAGAAFDGAVFDRLGGAHGIDAFEMGGSAYAIAAARTDGGVQLLRMLGNGSLLPAGSAGLGADFPELDGAHGVDVFGMANRTYALVASAGGGGGVQLIRLSPPSVANVTTSLPPDEGTLVAGREFNVTVAFDEPVLVSGPPPSLLLAFDGGNRAAEYLDGSGTRRLVFNYTMQPGDSTERLEYAGRAALATRGVVSDLRGTADPAASAAADLELPAPGGPGSLGYGRPAVAIDAAPPRVTGVTAPLPPPQGSAPDPAYRANDTVRITVSFDEPVRLSDRQRPALSLALDEGRTGTALYERQLDGGRALVFNYTVRPGDSADPLDYAGRGALSAGGPGASIRDEQGNVAGLPLLLPEPGGPGSLGSLGIRIDAVEPSVRDVYPRIDGGGGGGGGGAYNAGSDIGIAVRFSERVFVEGTPELALAVDPPAGAAYANGSGTDELAFVYTVRQGDNADPLEHAGRDALSAAGPGTSIRDGAGNAADLELPPGSSLRDGPRGEMIVVDTTPPRLVAANATSLRTILAVFDEPVSYAGGAIAGAAGWSISGEDAVAGLSVRPESAALTTAPPPPSTVLALAIAGRLPDTAPDIVLSYDAAVAAASGGGGGGGRIVDRAGNALPSGGGGGGGGVAVADRIRPGIDSSRIAEGGGGIEIRYTEPVSAPAGAYSELVLAGAGREITGVSGNDGSAAVHVLVFAPVGVDLNSTGTVMIDRAAVLDGADPPNPLGTGVIERPIADGRVSVDPVPPPVDPSDRPAPLSVSVLRRAGGDPVDSDASYTAGQDIAVEVRFTAPVDVDTTGGVPYVELRTGSSGARAGYASGSGTDALEFLYAVRGGDLADGLSYAGTGALRLNGSAILAAGGSGLRASAVLPAPGAPGSLSAPGSPAVRIDPEPGRPVLDVGILDDDGDAGGAAGGGVRNAALAAAHAFNEEQGRVPDALLINATAYGAGTTAATGSGAAAAFLQAAHAGGSGPSIYVGPSTDRGLHEAMPYAAGNGIALVSAGSTAPSLAVEDDWTFRLSPGGRLDAEALARLARTANAQSMVAVLENATHGPSTAAGASLADATPPPQDRFSRAFDAALAYAGTPTLSGTITLEGAAGGPYNAAAAAEALDAAVQAARSSPVAVVYAGSPDGLAALAEASDSYSALASAAWIASGQSANSSLLVGDGPAAAAAAFTAQVGLSAVRWSLPANDLARAVDLLLPPGADDGARHRAYAAYDAMGVIGAAAALAAADMRGDTPDAAAVAELVPGTAAAYDGALGDIALNYAGDLWVPAAYDLWTVERLGGAGTEPEWTLQQGALDETRACSIALTRAKIDYGPIDSGQTSRPHLQTIVNTGQLSFSRVDLTATPWHVDSPGSCMPGDTPSLPVGLSEIRTVQGGQFSDLAGSGTVLAQGLEAGSRSPLWYRLSLAGYADLPQAEITQCATYVVRCG